MLGLDIERSQEYISIGRPQRAWHSAQTLELGCLV